MQEAGVVEKSLGAHESQPNTVLGTNYLPAVLIFSHLHHSSTANPVCHNKAVGWFFFQMV